MQTGKNNELNNSDIVRRFYYGKFFNVRHEFCPVRDSAFAQHVSGLSSCFAHGEFLLAVIKHVENARGNSVFGKR